MSSHRVPRNREAHPLRRHALRRVGHLHRAHPHQLPAQVHERSAAVARIDRRIRLEQIFELRLADRHAAVLRAQDAPRHRAAVAQRIAQHEHRLPQVIRRKRAEIDKRQRLLRVDFQQRQIRLRRTGDVARRVGLPVIRRHGNLQFRRPLHHMLIGHDVARRIDDEPAPQALHLLRKHPRPLHRPAEELIEQLVHRVAHRPLDHALGIDIHHRRHGPAHGNHRRLSGGIDLRLRGKGGGKSHEEGEKRAGIHGAVGGHVRHAEGADVEKISQAAPAFGSAPARPPANLHCSLPPPRSSGAFGVTPGGSFMLRPALFLSK